tara:strand:+ start:36648 stop:36806 length:159 start_codon:yes stop_codon:yes gene_type:complete
MFRRGGFQTRPDEKSEAPLTVILMLSLSKYEDAALSFDRLRMRAKPENEARA